MCDATVSVEFRRVRIENLGGPKPGKCASDT